MEEKLCLLCGMKKKLINAHAIPKWAFKSIYPEDPEERRRPLILVSKGSKKRSPIGPYDQNILCGECDNFLGIYDEYAKEIFFNRVLEKYIGSDDAFIIKSVDIEKLKIFFISVAWRASISTRPEFNRVSLGPYEDKIGNILKNKKSGEGEIPDKYHFIVGKFEAGELPERILNQNIQIPSNSRVLDVNFIVLYLPKGFTIHIKFDKRELPESLKEINSYQEKHSHLIIINRKEYSKSREFEMMLDVVPKLKL